MKLEEPRPMCFRLQPLPSDNDGDHWQWTIHSYPDLSVMRRGQISGVREKAERAARAAIWIMGGIVKIFEEA